MLEGKADHDLNANPASKRFAAIYAKATVKGYAVENLPKLGIQKNRLPDGCKNEDGSYVFTDIHSLRTDSPATFTVNIAGDVYSGQYKGLAIIQADKEHGLDKFAAAGFTELSRNGRVLLSYPNPVDLYFNKQNGKSELTVKDPMKIIKPLINKLQ